MNLKRFGWLLIGILVISLALSACTRSLSSAPDTTGQQPLATPTITNGLPTAVTADAMAELMAFGTQTAMAEQGLSAATTEAPDANITPMAPAATTEAPPTPTPVLEMPTATPEPLVVPAAPPVPPSYTLHQGEFPYCLARRFNINPDQLLAANNLNPEQARIYYPGLTLTIPQNASPFPGERALRPHPATYTVVSADETIYSIACKYGDVDPITLAEYNNLSAPYSLSIGQTLNIP